MFNLTFAYYIDWAVTDESSFKDKPEKDDNVLFIS